MPDTRSDTYLRSILHELQNLPDETEWVEFKENNDHHEEIGEYISALSNSAALNGKVNGWMVWGVEDQGHAVVGTNFSPEKRKVGNEELENWLLRLLKPKIDFRFHTIEVDGLRVVMLEIQAAFRHPVSFKNTEFTRIGTYKKKLKEFPEKERELWKIFDQIPFEKEIALENVSDEEVLQLLDYPSYFDLLSTPLPENRSGILHDLEEEHMIQKGKGGKWDITNLGAILFAQKLSSFPSLERKSVRVILYPENNRLSTLREKTLDKGYACGFEQLISFIADLLPSNEVIGQALRKEVPMFPELAIREVVANAIIHQDFHVTGTSPMIELFSDRMEVTNPGTPLVYTERFLDSPPKSRNEALASFMRRVGVCEERGSGVDKIVWQTELYQLPAPLFETTEEHTRSFLFAYRELKDMDRDDRQRACYLHACLRYVQMEFMTNTSFRERFGIDKKNSATASRIIRDTIEAGLIRPYDRNAAKKYMKYVPWWA